MRTWNRLGAVVMLLPTLGGFAQEKVMHMLALDEALVVAYGLTGKNTFTGAIATAYGDRLLGDLPVITFEQAMQGAFAGVNVSPVSGQPGSPFSIRIRGTGSMNASQEPLYVIDGVPVISGNIAVSAISGDTKAFNIMASLNPGDIERIIILKDAASASLYGSRGANGVILITTKHGNSGKTIFRFKADWGMGDWAVANKETLSGNQQHELAYEAFYNQAILYNHKPESEATAYAETNANLYAPVLKQYSDWENALFRNRTSHQKYQLTASGGKARNTFYSSLTYNKEESMVKSSNLGGFTGRLNLSRQLSDRMNMAVNLALSKQHSEVVPETTKEINPWYMLHYAYKPNYPIYNTDGSWAETFGTLSLTNLAKEQGLDENTSDIFRNTTGLRISYDLTPDWRLSQTVNYDLILNESTLFWPPTSTNGKSTDGVGVKINQQLHSLYSSSLINYSHSFRRGHSVDLLAGWDVDDRTSKYLQAKGTDYPGGHLPELENAAVAGLVASGVTNDRLLSFLARLNYDYSGKYFLSANFRRDGSSRLAPGNRWGNFWSVGFAWRLRGERFMKELTAVNELKLRLSYGVNGTLPSAEYGHMRLIKYGHNYTDLPGMAPAGFASPDLSWEKNFSFNAGMDALLWNRLSITLDFYNRTTKDLLQDIPVSMVTGFRTALKNVGVMNNRGAEIDLALTLGRPKNVVWTTGLALSHNRNKIVRLYGGKDIVNGSRIWREGQSYFAFWSREWAGVDPATGEEQWVLNTPQADGSLDKTLTKDGNLAAKVIVGDAQPALTGGWRNHLTRKGIELSALFSFSLGGQVMDDLWTYTDSDGFSAITPIGVKQWNRWQKPGDKTDVPRRINGYLYGRHGSSRHLITTDHIRLKNLMLSWTLPAKIWGHSGINEMRIYAAASNLLTWAAYDGLDPEQPVEGFTTFAFPNMKSCTFGIEIRI